MIVRQSDSFSMQLNEQSNIFTKQMIQIYSWVALGRPRVIEPRGLSHVVVLVVYAGARLKQQKGCRARLE